MQADAIGISIEGFYLVATTRDLIENDGLVSDEIDTARNHMLKLADEIESGKLKLDAKRLSDVIRYYSQFALEEPVFGHTQ